MKSTSVIGSCETLQLLLSTLSCYMQNKDVTGRATYPAVSLDKR